MRLSTFLRFLGVAFALLVIPAFVAAQQSIKCEANNDNRKYCGSYNPDQVRFERQISGSFFCLRRGEGRESLGGYGDRISSIRVFGNARVSIYDDRDFRGARATTGEDVVDLRDWGVRQKPGHTWNNRISSLRVH